MTVLGKTQKSSENKVFTLHKEGLFYKCYNENAMLFAEKVKKYKISTKQVKSVGAAVLSLGFPVTVIAIGAITFDSIAVAIDATSYFEDTDAVVSHIKNKT
jgi:hypothetical protein